MTVGIKQSLADPISRDIGNKGVQKRLVSKTIKLAMFTTNENAVWAGNQQILKESYPFGFLRFPANRKTFRYEVGDCFKWNYGPYGITGMICRVLQKEEEDPTSERINIYAMEDIFSVTRQIGVYSDPVSHTIPAMDYTVLPFEHQVVIEPMYTFSKEIAVIPLACRRSSNDLGFELYMSIGGSYFLLGNVTNIQPYGTLVGGYSSNTYSIDKKIGFIVEFANNDVNQIKSVTSWADVLSGQKNLAIIINEDGIYEIISFKNITLISGYQYKIENVIRGRYGTVRQNHSEGEEFYFLGSGIAFVAHEEILAGVTRHFKLVPYNIKRVGNIDDCDPIELNIVGTPHTPYIPSNFCANGSQYVSRYDNDIVLTWSPRYRGRGAGIGIPGQVLGEGWVRHEGLFKVEVWVGGILKRTTTDIDDDTWTYMEAMNIADNGSLPSSVAFKLLNFARHNDGSIYESAQAEVVCKKN